MQFMFLWVWLKQSVIAEHGRHKTTQQPNPCVKTQKIKQEPASVNSTRERTGRRTAHGQKLNRSQRGLDELNEDEDEEEEEEEEEDGGWGEEDEEGFEEDECWNEELQDDTGRWWPGSCGWAGQPYSGRRGTTL